MSCVNLLALSTTVSSAEAGDLLRRLKSELFQVGSVLLPVAKSLLTEALERPAMRQSAVAA